MLGFVALSNYCKACEERPEEDDADYDSWEAAHRGKCQKNIDCSSAAMESEGAVILFKRSVDLHGFRYTSMLGDGDAKTHSRLVADDPYGGHQIDKLECINHVTKRKATALRNLVAKMRAQGEPIGGKGKLTELRIKQLTNYYGRAIKDNSDDLEKMQEAVWASFFSYSEHR